MTLKNLRQSLRQALIRQFLRLMNTEEMRHAVVRTLPDYSDIRRRISTYPDPYRESQPVRHNPLQHPPIFITGRFRSGSTLLWNIFRNLEEYTAYYEPFNERRWFNMTQRGDHIDASHRGVSEYWSEYAGLGELDEYYREDWIRHHLYMDEHAFDYAMNVYVNRLVSSADSRAVLQFNRTDFRLGWLRANYPQAHIVHIFRHPRDQWCSVLRDIQRYPSSAISAQGFTDHFYLRMWSLDLSHQFPFLSDYQDRHQYYLFYFLWKLSYCFGCHYADISVAMEDLTNNPEHTVYSILKAIDGAGNGLPENIDLSFVKQSESRWLGYAPARWFQAIEDECDAVIGEFLQGEPKL